MGKLTALQVKHAKPGRHADGKGLHLLVKPSGSKSWVLRAQSNGRRHDFGLGPVDLVSLQEARDKAIEGRKMLRAGFNPAVEWKRSIEDLRRRLGATMRTSSAAGRKVSTARNG